MQKISIKTEFITLGQFLKFSGIISNGSEAKFFVLEEKILVNGIEENRRGRKLYDQDIIEIFGIKYQIFADVN